MNTTINPNVQPLPPSKAAGAPAASTDAKGPGRAGSDAAPEEAAHIQLTRPAQAFGSSGAADAGAPVDLQRVAQLRQAMAKGQFRIDPQSIANHLIDLEKQLG